MILIIFAHPSPRQSLANRPIIEQIAQMDNVVVSDIYEKYPDFHINIKEEQELLKRANLIVFQFPLYWYNIPALLKQWQEVVLTRKFAIGKADEERHLKNKSCMAVVTTGHKKNSYTQNGYDHYAVETFLIPMHQMAEHCQMNYHPPLVLHQAHKASDLELNYFINNYQQHLLKLYSSVKNTDE